MTMPSVSMRALLEAGVHFGHHSRRWNPQMKTYIFGVRNGIHIIDLQKSLPMMEQGLKVLRDVAAQGGRVLFVGTKRQARERVAEAAQKCGQYYVNQRWLGGMLTNWKTISHSINRLQEVEDILAQEETGLTKKELLQLERERDKLTASIGGIRGMGGLPDALFIIDTNKEDIAVAEAKKLGIPTVAIIDTNSDPYVVDHPIPGNDDAMRAIDLYCDLASSAILDGIQAELASSGTDIGADANPAQEDLPAEKGATEDKGEDKAEKASKDEPKRAAAKKAAAAKKGVEVHPEQGKATDAKAAETDKKEVEKEVQGPKTSQAKKKEVEGKSADAPAKAEDDKDANGDEEKKKAASAG